MRIPLTILSLFLAAPVASAQLAILDTQVNPANGNTYHLLDESTWTAAEAEAVVLGGNLVTINDAAENLWVFNSFGNFGAQSRDLWIGLNDFAVEGTYVWSSGQLSSYINWAPGQPDNNGGTTGVGEDYCHIYGYQSQWGPELWNDMFNATPGSAGWSPGYYGVVEIENVGLSLAVNGACPGPVTVDVSNATPGVPVYIGYAFASAPGVVQTGPCGSLAIELVSPVLAAVVIADAQGNVSLPATLTAGACGNVFVQCFDPATCTVSPVVAL